MSQSRLDHAAFLAKKKADYLKKKQEEEQKKLEALKPKPPPAQPAASAQAPKNPSKVLGFSNDGSFMARFLEMQKKMQGQSGSVKTEEPKTAGSSTSVRESSTSRNIKIEPSSSTFSSSHSRVSMKLSEVKKEEVLPSLDRAKPSAFQDDDDDDSHSSKDDPYVVARELAERVASEGVNVEAEARMKYQNDSRYRFLYESNSDVTRYYQKCVKDLKMGNDLSTEEEKKGKKRRWDDSQTVTPVQPSASASTLQPSTSGTQPPLDPMSEFEKAKALIKAKALALKAGAGIPTGIPVKTEEDIKREKDIEEQRMMQDIYRKVVEQQALAAKEKAKRAKSGKVKYEYDSDEEIDDEGTWEHKKRTMEMQKTKEWAMQLTEDGRGKHHLADFLPPDELEKFLEKVKAVREGRDADFSDYSKYRIQSDNVGFKLLQKAGWEEGKGLGSEGQGITAPINKGKTSFDNSGLGTEKPAEVKKDDDDFDTYRKRMMLAYKFRPNPLNNPRRPYY